MRERADSPATVPITVIIPTYRRPRLVGGLLECIGRCRPAPREVIICDSSDDNSTAQVLRRFQSAFEKLGCELRWVPSSKGLTRQRNKGVKSSSCPCILFLDDDTEVPDGIFAVLMAAVASDPNRTVKGFGLMIGEPGCEQGRPGGGYYDEKGRPHRGAVAESGKVDFLEGCSLYRREVFCKLSFAEAFVGYGQGEDRLFGGLVGTMGRLKIVPGALITHMAVGGGRPSGFEKGFWMGRNHSALGFAIRRAGVPYPALRYAARVLLSAALHTVRRSLTLCFSGASMHLGRALGVVPGVALGLFAPDRALGLSGVLQ